MLHLNVGLSALQASQQALFAISNNIANANTEGYHKQRIELIERHPVTVGPLQIGSGVQVQGLTRLRDSATEGALVSTNSLLAESESYLRVLGQIESALLPTQGSLISSVSNFFNELEQLAAQPATVTIRDAVLAAARDVVNQLNQLDSRLNQLRTNNAIQIAEDIDVVNQSTQRIAELNQEIRILGNSGAQPNTLLDQRDRFISDLSQKVDVSLQSLFVPGSPLVAASGALIVAEKATQLLAVTSPDGRAAIQTQSGALPVLPASGSLAGLLAGQHAIDSIQSSLQDWAHQFIQAIDQLHATGLGQNVQQGEIQGSRSLTQMTTPLAEIETPFRIESGQLFVTITENSTGIRSTTVIDVDKDSDSLNDVLSKLNAVTHLTALSQLDSQQVLLRADTGYSIDFAGGVDPLPYASTFSGTALPTLSGFLTETENRRWTATVVGSGDVGVTSGLHLEVTDTATNTLIRSIPIGAGYLPGERLLIDEGVEIAFSAGSLVDGETLSFDVVNQPDETGLLVVMGLNTLFSGNAATGFGLNPEVTQSPLNLAASRTGATGDSRNLQRMIHLRDSVVFAERNETIEQRLASLTTETAFQVQAEQASLEFLQAQQDHLKNVQSSVSGVDPNEEFLNMLEFQRQFQAASRFITVINDALNELLGLVG